MESNEVIETNVSTNINSVNNNIKYLKKSTKCDNDGMLGKEKNRIQVS